MPVRQEVEQGDRAGIREGIETLLDAAALLLAGHALKEQQAGEEIWVRQLDVQPAAEVVQLLLVGVAPADGAQHEHGAQLVAGEERGVLLALLQQRAVARIDLLERGDVRGRALLLRGKRAADVAHEVGDGHVAAPDAEQQEQHAQQQDDRADDAHHADEGVEPVELRGDGIEHEERRPAVGDEAGGADVVRAAQRDAPPGLRLLPGLRGEQVDGAVGKHLARPQQPALRIEQRLDAAAGAAERGEHGRIEEEDGAVARGERVEQHEPVLFRGRAVERGGQQRCVRGVLNRIQKGVKLRRLREEHRRVARAPGAQRERVVKVEDRQLREIEGRVVRLDRLIRVVGAGAEGARGELVGVGQVRRDVGDAAEGVRHLADRLAGGLAGVLVEHVLERRGDVAREPDGEDEQHAADEADKGDHHGQQQRAA